MLKIIYIILLVKQNSLINAEKIVSFDKTFCLIHLIQKLIYLCKQTNNFDDFYR